MLAIHHFDNSIEILLKCIATKRGSQSQKPQNEFEHLLSLPDVPLKEQIRGLHRARNAAQHQGDIPSYDTVIKYKGYVEDFFKEACIQEFNIPFEEVFLCQLVENDKLKEKLLQAESSYNNQDYMQCITLCEEVFTSVVFDEANIFYTGGQLSSYWGASEELKMVLQQGYPEKYKNKEFYGLAKELHGAINQLTSVTIGTQFLGDYRMDFLRHRKVIENIETLSASDLKENAPFSLNFVVNIILRWQADGLLKSNASS